MKLDDRDNLNSLVSLRGDNNGVGAVSAPGAHEQPAASSEQQLRLDERRQVDSTGGLSIWDPLRTSFVQLHPILLGSFLHPPLAFHVKCSFTTCMWLRLLPIIDMFSCSMCFICLLL
jgi:hypothetical protein